MDAGPLAPAAISFVVPGVPVAWARAGSKAGVRFTPAKQRGTMAQVKALCVEAMGGAAPFVGPVEMSVRATWPAPPSWSAKKRAGAKWKTSRPDSSNICKLIEDALIGVAYLDDAQIVSSHTWKTIGDRAELAVRIVELR
jgi:Holliday junction resolvase RusA-like endonuclease